MSVRVGLDQRSKLNAVSWNRLKKLPWPEDARPDERFSGMDGAVAEMVLDGQPVGYAMMLIQEWATLGGRPWGRRLVDPRTLPELHFAFRDTETGVQRDYDFDSLYANDASQADALFSGCVLGQRVNWEGSTYELRWLDDQTSARLRSELFWDTETE